MDKHRIPYHYHEWRAVYELKLLVCIYFNAEKVKYPNLMPRIWIIRTKISFNIFIIPNQRKVSTYYIDGLEHSKLHFWIKSIIPFKHLPYSQHMAQMNFCWSFHINNSFITFHFNKGRICQEFLTCSILKSCDKWWVQS